MEKLRSLILEHRWFILYCLGATVVLVCLNYWLWPTPDEYYYANLSEAFAAAQRGEIVWSDINTEHVGTVPYLSFLYSWLTGSDSFVQSRMPMAGFGLGCIILFYALGRSIGLPKKQQLWFLWLLLLIPGFWIFSVRFMLDVPATFSLLLLIWLLIKKSPAYQVALGVLLVLLIKEYYLYITIPLIVTIYTFDTLTSKQRWYWAILSWCGRLLLTYLPTLLAIVVLIDFNLFPYPRLLETSLIAIFGDIFGALNRATLSGIQLALLLYQRYVHWLSSPIIRLLVVQIVPISVPLLYSLSHRRKKRFNYRWLIAWIGLIIAWIGYGVTMYNSAQPTTVDTTNVVLEEKIDTIQFSGVLPTGAFASQISSPTHTWWEKIWLIYRYNFSESDIHIFLLPLALIGIIVSLHSIWNHRRRYQLIQVRTQLILLLFLSLMLYFNWYEANNLHGFRVTIPIIVPLLYFAYVGSRQLLEQFRWVYASLFVGAMSASIILYWQTIRGTTYGSIIANSGWLQMVLSYKLYLFIGLFIILTIGIILFPYYLKTWRWKYPAAIGLVVGLFAVKMLPFYFDHVQSLQLYGYDFGLTTATPVLHNIAMEDELIFSNVHNYKVQYYAQDVRIANNEVHPIFRTFNTPYGTLYYIWPIDDSLLESLRVNGIHYVLLVNEDYGELDRLALRAQIAKASGRFTVVEEHYQADRLQWVLFHYAY